MTLLERGPSLTDQAAQEIRARIVRGEFRLGEPLSEITLANLLGVSKTPVREALMELKRQGLVEVQAQRGTFVFDMNATQVERLSEHREILEVAALKLALARNAPALHQRWSEIAGLMVQSLAAGDAERYRTLDGEFHLAMFEIAENPFLQEAFQLIAFRVQTLRNRLSLDPMLNNSSIKEHQQLTRLVGKTSTREIINLLKRHIGWTREHYLQALGDDDASSAITASRLRSRSGAG